MSSIGFIVFMLVLTISEALRCIDQNEIQLSISHMQMDNIQQSLADLKSSNNEKCQVYIEFNSITQEFIIKFGHALEIPRLRSVENTYIGRSTLIQTNNNNTSILTKIEIVCYSNNECDRELVIEGIQWLLKTDYQQLDSIFHSLLSTQNKSLNSNHCTIGDKDQVESCSYDACSWSYSFDRKQGEGNCENIDVRMLPNLYLTSEIRFFEKYRKDNDEEMRFIRAVFKHESSMKFSCQLNNCNNHQNGQLIKQTISQYNRLWSNGNQTNIFFLIEN